MERGLSLLTQDLARMNISGANCDGDTIVVTQFNLRCAIYNRKVYRNLNAYEESLNPQIYVLCQGFRQSTQDFDREILMVHRKEVRWLQAMPMLPRILHKLSNCEIVEIVGALDQSRPEGVWRDLLHFGLAWGVTFLLFTMLARNTRVANSCILTYAGGKLLVQSLYPVYPTDRNDQP